MSARKQVDLSAGTVEYHDTGGDGPVLVFISGLTIDGTVWRHVVERLVPDFRCILPTLPLGAHRIPMHEDADLSLRGLGLLIGEFLERLDLADVTLVQNDWGDAQVLIALGDTSRVAALVLTPCEAFDNYPPGIPGRAIGVAVAIPGGLALTMQALRFRAIRRAPAAWGLDEQATGTETGDGRLVPARDHRPPGAARPAQVHDVAATQVDAAGLGGSEPELRPAGPRAGGCRGQGDAPRPRPAVGGTVPTRQLREVEDSHTLMPEDRPDVVAEALRLRRP